MYKLQSLGGRDQGVSASPHTGHTNTSACEFNEHLSPQRSTVSTDVKRAEGLPGRTPSPLNMAVNSDKTRSPSLCESNTLIIGAHDLSSTLKAVLKLD